MPEDGSCREAAHRVRQFPIEDGGGHPFRRCQFIMTAFHDCPGAAAAVPPNPGTSDPVARASVALPPV